MKTSSFDHSLVVKLIVLIFFVLPAASLAAGSSATQPLPSPIVPHSTTSESTMESPIDPSIKVPSVQVASPGPYDAASGSALPACPAQFACPDIDGVIISPDGAQQTPVCPSACTVTDTYTYSGSTTNPITGATINTVSDVLMATCPAGYVEVSTYNAQPEYALNSSPTPMPFPIYDMSTFMQYANAGYTCSSAAAAPSSNDVNYFCSGNAAMWDDSGAAARAYFAANIPAFSVRNIAPYGIIVAAASNPYRAFTTAIDSGCNQSLPVWEGVAHENEWAYQIAPEQCTRPAGVTQTLRYRDATRVCARVSLTWTTKGAGYNPNVR